MTDIFTLADEPATIDPSGAGSNSTSKPATSGWQPSSQAKPFTVPGASSPAKTVKKGKVTKIAAAKEKKVTGKRGAALAEHGYVPLPEPKVAKPLGKSAQAKADKAQLTKEREADAATMRINGVDGEVEIPKKPFLTIFNGKRARPEETAETLTDLASMLENGESERRSVNALAEQYSEYDIGQAYERVVMLLDRGVTLSKAMADQTDTFPAVVRELIGAAKMPTDMHRNLKQASIIIKEADNIKGQVKSALFKPGFMAFFLMIFIIASVQYLLPMTSSMFTGIGTKAPASTTLIIAVGGVVKYVLIVVIVLSIVFALAWNVFLKNNETVATKMDKMMIGAPLIGDIIRMSTAARFCDVLSSCLAVGMSELESLETASRACGNRAVAAWVEDHIGRQRVGVVSFGDVAKTDLLPWNFRNRIEFVQSLVGRIEVLRELGTTFHAKSQERLTRFAERIGPISEGVMVVVIVFVVLLVVSPVLTFIPTMIKTIS